jgi:hypothetical protein
MEINENEWTICPAIWIDDGKKHEKQPKNIETGYVVFGLNIVDLFSRMNIQGKGKPLNPDTIETSNVHEGYYTNKGRFVERLIDY